MDPPGTLPFRVSRGGKGDVQVLGSKGLPGFDKDGLGKSSIGIRFEGGSFESLQKGVRNFQSFKLDLCQWSPNK